MNLLLCTLLLGLRVGLSPLSTVKPTAPCGQVGLSTSLQYSQIIIEDCCNFSIHTDSTGIPPTIVVVNVVKTSVYAYMIFLVTVGVLLSIICLLFNIIFRNRKLVNCWLSETNTNLCVRCTMSYYQEYSYTCM